MAQWLLFQEADANVVNEVGEGDAWLTLSGLPDATPEDHLREPNRFWGTTCKQLEATMVYLALLAQSLPLKALPHKCRQIIQFSKLCGLCPNVSDGAHD